ncbi:START domain-containing protein [Vibrio sp. ZSDE26]|uniref:START domain-containing protein n=1 Tax=Vibrio amylolyticus TaxID=2847292 RepID=A0A9X1XJF8_9VIBR|nr:START domain-containing protein [Vibrio amylolyticus]MCK6264357.1 START domain-containing protein [Vibrio amylolyticus]
MRFLFFSLLLPSFLLLSPLAYGAPTVDWQFVKTEDAITLHTRPHEGGLIEIRAQMFIETNYSAFLLLLEDTEHVPRWINNVEKSQVLRQISPNENVVYTQFKAPWPALDRDMVTYSRYDFNQGAFVLQINDAPSMLPEQPGYIRIFDIEATWTLEKLTNGMTHIEYIAFADPSGILPDWLVNKLAINSALKTFQGLRTEIVQYQNSTHPNINHSESSLINLNIDNKDTSQ